MFTSEVHAATVCAVSGLEGLTVAHVISGPIGQKPKAKGA